MIDPTDLVRHIDDLADPVSPTEIRHGARRRPLAPTLLIIALIAVLAAAVLAWNIDRSGGDEQPADSVPPDVEVTVPDTIETSVPFGPAPDLIPLTPPLAEWELTRISSFREPAAPRRESRYVRLADTRDHNDATIRVWTAPTDQFSDSAIWNETPITLSDGRSGFASSIGGTNVRVEIDNGLSLAAQGQGLTTDEVERALLGTEILDDVPTIPESALPAGFAPISGGAGSTRWVNTSWRNGDATVVLEQIDGARASPDWRRCCLLTTRWTPDSGADPVPEHTGDGWVLQIDDDTTVTIRRTGERAVDAPRILTAVASPEADDWLAALETHLFPEPDEQTILPAGPLSSRADALVAWTGDHVVVWGGEHGGETLDDGAVYDLETRTWHAMAPHPDPPVGAAMAVLDGKAVVFGGATGTGETTTATIYDPRTDGWQTLPPLAVDGPIDAASLVDDGLVVRAADGFQHHFAILRPSAQAWTEYESPPSIALTGSWAGALPVSDDGRWLAYVGSTPFSELGPGDPRQRLHLLDLETGRWATPDPEPIADTSVVTVAWQDDRLAAVWQADLFLDSTQTTFEVSLLDPVALQWAPTATDEIDCVSPSLESDRDGLTLHCRRLGNAYRVLAGAFTPMDDSTTGEPWSVPEPEPTGFSAVEERSAGPYGYIGGDGIPNTFVRRSEPPD